MELLFGTHVRSAGRRIGYLAGLEVAPASRSVTKIIFSEDGKLGAHAHTRPLSAVRVEKGALTFDDVAAGVTPGSPILWSRSIRVVRDGREVGRLAGAVLTAEGRVQTILARQHWWSRRVRLSAEKLELTTPGEIRTTGAASLAA
jgi:hypothetical protein